MAVRASAAGESTGCRTVHRERESLPSEWLDRLSSASSAWTTVSSRLCPGPGGGLGVGVEREDLVEADDAQDPADVVGGACECDAGLGFECFVAGDDEGGDAAGIAERETGQVQDHLLARVEGEVVEGIAQPRCAVVVEFAGQGERGAGWGGVGGDVQVAHEGSSFGVTGGIPRQRTAVSSSRPSPKP